MLDALIVHSFSRQTTDVLISTQSQSVFLSLPLNTAASHSFYIETLIYSASFMLLAPPLLAFSFLSSSSVKDFKWNGLC